MISSNFFEWKVKSNKSKRSQTVLNLDETLLDQVFPVDAGNSFQRYHFQKHPVVRRNVDLSTLIEHLHDLDVRSLLRDTASDQIHVWLNTTHGEQLKLDCITVEDADQALKLHLAGHSLYFRASSEIEQKFVSTLLQELNFGIANTAHSDRYRRGEVETFISRAGHVTDFHTDFQENFTFQLSGSKRWIFRSSSATNPIRGCTPHFNLEDKNRDVAEQQLKVLRLGDPSFQRNQFQINESNNESSITLHPGDVMYHPAGIWHRVECLEDSISINVSLTALSYADIFCSSLQQILLENPAWRSGVFPTENTSKFGVPHAKEVMQSLLQAVPVIVSTLSVGDVLPFPTLCHNHETKEAKDVDEDGNGNEMAEQKEEEENSEENEDNEEEESVANNPSLTVVIDEVILPSFFNGTESFSSSKKRKAKTVEARRYRWNSIAILLTPEQIFLSPNAAVNEENTTDERRYIINCGFGNETLESTCRTVVLVSKKYYGAIDYVLSRYQQHRNQRQAIFQAWSPASVDSFAILSAEQIMGNDLIKAKVKISEEDIERLLYGLHQAALLTLVD